MLNEKKYSPFYSSFLSLCSQKGISPSVAARDSGISSGAPTAWKNGAVPKPAQREKLCSYFGVTDEVLLGYAPKEKASAPKGDVDEELISMYLELDEPHRKMLMDYLNFLIQNQDKFLVFSVNDDIESLLERYKQGMLMGITVAQAGKFTFPPVDFNSLAPELRATVEAELEKEREKLLAERQSKK